MSFTDREMKVWDSIRQWEKKLEQYDPTDFELMFDKYVEQAFSMLPEDTQTKFFETLDSWLFHLHAFIQGSQIQHDAKERILSMGRIFQSDIETLDDLRSLHIDQLQYMANQQIARHRLYSLAQGGLSGTGGVLLLGSDIPAMAVVNLRVIQLIAMTYGFEVNTPFEMMTSLKVFHAATLPKRLEKYGWESLMKELDEATDAYFYEGDDRLTDLTWLEQPMKQLCKLLVISIAKKRTVQGVPLVSMMIGANANYQLTRKVTEFAHKYYQLRFLMYKRDAD